MVGQVGGVGHGKDAGELDAQIVPVADLVACLLYTSALIVAGKVPYAQDTKPLKSLACVLAEGRRGANKNAQGVSLGRRVQKRDHSRTILLLVPVLAAIFQVQKARV